MGSPRGSVGRDRGDAAGRANAGQKETGSPPNDPTSASVGELVVECACGNEKLCRLVATGLHTSDRQLCSPHRECGCASRTRLEQGGLDPLQQLARSYSTRLPERLAPLVQTPLAAWAREIVSIDESTLDAVQRWLEPLRHRPKGDPALLAGKIAGRFNLRSQQWDLLQSREPGVGQLQSGSAQLAGRTGARQSDPLRFGLFQFRLVRLVFPKWGIGTSRGCARRPPTAFCTPTIVMRASLTRLCGWGPAKELMLATPHAWCAFMTAPPGKPT
jgi:hypothetical protein